MLGGEYNWIITSELANERAPKALFSYVVYTNDSKQFFFEIEANSLYSQGLKIRIILAVAKSWDIQSKFHLFLLKPYFQT